MNDVHQLLSNNTSKNQRMGGRNMRCAVFCAGMAVNIASTLQLLLNFEWM